MSALPVIKTRPKSAEDQGGGCGSGCGDSCGAGLEKIYPTIAVRHGAMNWIGEFEYKPGTVFSCGAHVVIQSDRGIELGNQVSVSCGGCAHSVSRDQIKRYIDNSGPEFFRLRAGRILREATPQDIEEAQRLNATLMQDIEQAQLIAAQMELDLKIITCEHLLGGERIVYYFRADGRVDFRDLVRELAKFHQTRIELRQVGARDEARLVADYEICGRECCCKNFLKKLRPVTMKMAKLQKSTLDPSKVSGRCGRLRCCLRYEHEGYEELARKLPRIGATVETQFGTARVVDRQILTQLVLVRTESDGREYAVPVEEIGRPDRPAPEAAPPVESRETVADDSAASGEPGDKRRGRGRRGGGRSAPDRDAKPADESRRESPAAPEPPRASDDERPSDGRGPRDRGRRRRRRRRDGGDDRGATKPNGDA